MKKIIIIVVVTTVINIAGLVGISALAQKLAEPEAFKASAGVTEVSKTETKIQYQYDFEDLSAGAIIDIVLTTKGKTEKKSYTVPQGKTATRVSIVLDGELK